MLLERPVRIADQIWPEGVVPALSVFSWVFNHKNFIHQSIQSILNQETSFPVEIIIHDDASSDGTAEIILDYEKMYPQLFRNILQKDNQWSQGKCVVRPLFEMPRGEFITLTHGDDYWTDSKKLETQFRYMLENQDCVGCFHQSQLVDENNNVLKDHLYDYDQSKYNMLEAFSKLRSRYSTASLFFKNIFGEINLPEWFLKNPNDMALEILLSQYGFFGYIDKNMSDYRKHIGGIWSQKTLEMQHFELMHRFQNYLDDNDFPSVLKPIVKDVFKEIQDKHPLKFKVQNLENSIDDLKRQIDFANENLKMIKKSFSWKITLPLRRIQNSCRKLF